MTNAIIRANANTALASWKTNSYVTIMIGGVAVPISAVTYVQLCAANDINSTPHGNQGQSYYGNLMLAPAVNALNAGITQASGIANAVGSAQYQAFFAGHGYTAAQIVAIQYSHVVGGVMAANAANVAASLAPNSTLGACMIGIAATTGDAVLGVGMVAIGNVPAAAIAGLAAIASAGVVVASGICTPSQLQGSTVPGISPVGPSGGDTTVGAGDPSGGG